MDERQKKKIYTVPEIYMNGTDGGDFHLSSPKESDRETAVAEKEQKTRFAFGDEQT